MRRWRVLGGAAALAALAAGGPAWGAFGASTANVGNVFTASSDFCPTFSVQVSASADAWVDEQSPNSNHGTDSRLELHSSNTKDRRVLANFSLPARPPGCLLTGATLSLYATTGASETRILQAFAVASAWTEGGATWSNQPATTGAAAEVTSPTTAGWRHWVVTTHVQGMYAGTAFGFLLKDRDEDDPAGRVHRFESREATSDQPRLTLTFS